MAQISHRSLKSHSHQQCHIIYKCRIDKWLFYQSRQAQLILQQNQILINPQISFDPVTSSNFSQKDLNLSQNQLTQLPQNMNSFRVLKKLNLQGNFFDSTYKAAFFWASLASIPSLVHINIRRNKMRGIHTEMLAAGNFHNLSILDFSFNNVENQHNLICARNFPSLTQLIVTGNPFALVRKFMGLEMQVYARTGGQLVNQQIDYYYLKKKKKDKMPIKFQKLHKIQPDRLGKSHKYLFGMQIPDQEQKDIQLSQEKLSNEEVKSQQEIQQQKGMFVTQNNQIQKRKRQSKVYNSPMKHSFGKDSNILKSNKMESSTFNKIARQIFGNSKEYKTSFDLNTAYKLLKNQVKRQQEELQYQKKMQKNIINK